MLKITKFGSEIVITVFAETRCVQIRRKLELFTLEQHFLDMNIGSNTGSGTGVGILFLYLCSNCFCKGEDVNFHPLHLCVKETEFFLNKTERLSLLLPCEKIVTDMVVNARLQDKIQGEI